jgi:hypothetical protein
MVGSIAAVHAAGIVHRGVGPACFGVSTLDEREAAALRVRLDNFGFSLVAAQAAEDSVLVRRAAIARAERPGARDMTQLPSSAELAALLERDDLRALGYSVLEVLLSVSERLCSDAPPAPGGGGGGAAAPDTSSASVQATLRRLVEDVYDGDMLRFREYCAADSRWREAVALLDRQGGAGGTAEDGRLGGGWLLLGELLGDGSDAQATGLGEGGELCIAKGIVQSCEWLRL